jgi:hypothetical protein
MRPGAVRRFSFELEALDFRLHLRRGHRRLAIAKSAIAQPHTPVQEDFESKRVQFSLQQSGKQPIVHRST